MWWWYVASLEQRGLSVVVVSPTSRMMYATGKGNAGKDLVMVTTAATYKQAEVTGNDVADAVVIAAMVSRLAGQPIELRQPAQAKLKALAKVKMPDGMDSRSEEHTSELQSRGHLVCRLLLERKNVDETCS